MSVNNNNYINQNYISILSLVFFILMWQLGSIINPEMLPSPRIVVEAVYQVLTEAGPRGKTGMFHLYTTLLRVAAVLVISLVFSLLFGILMGIDSRIESVLSIFLPFWMTTPGLVAILLAMIILGFNQLSIVISVSFLAIPFGIVNIWEGIKDLDSRLLDMASAFDSDSRLIWRYIYIPHLLPYISASSRYLLGIIWKVVLLGETLGMSTGMGAVIRFWFKTGNLRIVLAYLVLFIAVVFIIEYGILKRLEKIAFKWRPN